MTTYIEDRHKRRAAYIKRAAKAFAHLDAKPDSEWRFMEALDALRFVLDSDVSDELADAMFSLGMDEDGIKLDDMGMPTDTRLYVPLRGLTPPEDPARWERGMAVLRAIADERNEA